MSQKRHKKNRQSSHNQPESPRPISSDERYIAVGALKKTVYVKTLRYLLYSLAFVPLIFASGVLFPFIFGKVAFVRLVVTLFWVVFAIYVFVGSKDDINPFINKVKRLIRNPLFLLTTIFIGLMLVSTIFGVDAYRSFFGDIERGEGFLGIFYFFAFFVAALLVFNKKSWLNFLKLSLITGGILFVDAIRESINGIARPQSLTGNPTFLAGYFIFIVFAGLVIFLLDDKRWMRYLAASMSFIGVVGVFLTQTRGAILGILFGMALAIAYSAIRGKELKLFKKIDVQKVSIALLAFGIVFLGAFVVTRNNPVWQKIPGVNRFATISLQDATLQTRLISAGISINAVHPSNSIERFLIGWGPDNFNVAYNKYYNPEYLRYENLWFDRAHNKVLDVLVMNGTLGLLTYLGLWFFALYTAFKKRVKKEYAIPILFFGGAYFVQNLFVFDQVSTYIPFFAFLAFTVFTGISSKEDYQRDDVDKSVSDAPQSSSIDKYAVYYIVPTILVAVFFLYSLIAYTFVPYYQTKTFITSLRDNNGVMLSQNSDKFLNPYNYAQSEIRYRFLSALMPYINNPNIKPLVDKAINAEEEAVAREPYEPRAFILLGGVYNQKARISGGSADFAKADEYYKKAHELTPARQETFYYIAANYADWGKLDEAKKYLDDMLAESPNVPMTKIYYGTVLSAWGSGSFVEAMNMLESALNDPTIYVSENETAVLRNAYNLYMNYFYKIRDEDRFLTALDRARKVEIRIEEIQQGKLEQGLIKGVDPKRSIELKKAVEAFKVRGWDAIAPPKKEQ